MLVPTLLENQPQALCVLNTVLSHVSCAYGKMFSPLPNRMGVVLTALVPLFSALGCHYVTGVVEAALQL